MREYKLKPLEGMTKAALILIKLEIVALTFSILAEIYSWYDYTFADSSINVDEELVVSDIVGLVFVLPLIGVIITSFVIYLIWLYRVNNNLHVHSEKKLHFTPGWCVGWYFIPIACLFKPYQVMKEIYLTSLKGDKYTDTSIVGLWWTLWIFSNVLGQIIFKITWKTDLLNDPTSSLVTSSIADVIDIVLALVLLNIIRRIIAGYSNNYSNKVSLESTTLSGAPLD